MRNMITVSFDKRTRRALHVGQGECAFCGFTTRVAKANPEMWICAKCFADTEMPGAIGAAEREGFSGDMVVHAKVEDL